MVGLLEAIEVRALVRQAAWTSQIVSPTAIVQLTKTLCHPATRYEVVVSPVGDLIGRKPGTVSQQQASAKEQ